MKKIAKIASVFFGAAALCMALAGCTESDEVRYLEDPNRYTFTNPGHPVAETDADMTIDGVFDEARWKEVRWLAAVDRINAQQYADIEFTTSYGEKGIYFGMKVEETGTTIIVNPGRTSYYNSSIEMYMGPNTEGGDSPLCFEFDFMPNGTYVAKLNYNGWNAANTTWDKMPVMAATLIGGELNTPECYGYTIEAFFPWAYLEFANYDVDTAEKREALVLGINPVHIFSFTYEGTDLNEDRFWSDWSTDYIASAWQTPSSFFHFGKDGLLAYDFTVTYSGSGKGTVAEKHGWDYVLRQTAAEFTIKTINGAAVTSLTVDGVDYTRSLRGTGGDYTFSIAQDALKEGMQIAVTIE